ncbi:FAD-dependent oxidoreductase [Alkalibacter rhizosphaerae]|uniref:FAD-dependent oxidoreductase n=1 Tax=Alkalibacter rhizosphaerae TaxID=2815577 RepID=A0A974XE97_9FIRM|nr:FAD-dependent oxidoreductase [Alkalibacter rhizosphaerae]QSX08233.1 FAD-dependent oxidoreductase [Alkalibacter rhizosphaerae]
MKTMNNQKFKHLFEPIILGKQVFRNRIFNSPTGVTEQPIQDSMNYYERKALGGAASVCIGDACTSLDGMSRPGHINLWDETSKLNLIDIAYAINRHGAVASMEILHSGNCSYHSYSKGFQPYGAVGGMTPFGQEILEMPEEMILRYIDDFARSAAYAKKCGYGMVTVHGGHGWLISQFFSKENMRKDKWGGTPENRARFAVAVCDRIHQVCGSGYPVEIRISGSEVFDGGYGVETGIEQAKFLDGHADLIHVSAGSHEVNEVFTVTHPSMFLEDGVNVKYAAEIKKHVKNSAIATVGALSEPELMEEIIASGRADVVELARGLICDPDLPIKLQTGKEDEINKCMRCLYCFSHRMQKEKIVCAINPEIGNEEEIKYNNDPPRIQKRVLVVGGGMAGMEAALTSADRGHQVILCEKNSKLGGVLLCEEKVSFKEKLGQYIELQTRLISRHPNIEVQLNTEVTPVLAEEIAADVIMAALGARPIKPKIPGIDGKNVFSAEEIYLDPAKVGNKVIILGGGLVGMELSVFLAMSGRQCTIIEMMPELNDGGNNLQGLALSIEIDKYGIQVSPATKAVEINEKGVVGSFTGEKPPEGFRFGLPNYKPESQTGTKLFEGDTVVYAVGQKPLWEEARKLLDCAPEFHPLGDCMAPKNIWNATNTAHFVSRDLGRY